MICAINSERRSSGVLSTQLTDDCPVYHAWSDQISRAKLITSFDDRYAVAKFSKSRVWNKVPERSTLISEDTRISLQHSVGQVESSHTKNQADSSSSFDRTTTCDRQTQTDAGPQLVPALAQRREGKNRQRRMSRMGQAPCCIHRPTKCQAVTGVDGIREWRHPIDGFLSTHCECRRWAADRDACPPQRDTDAGEAAENTS